VSDDYLWDRSGTPDPTVAELEAMLAPLRLPASLRTLPTRVTSPRSKPYAFLMVLMAEAAMVAALVGSAWMHPVAPAGPALEVTRLSGAPRVGSRVLADRGNWTVGRWLQTDASSRAEIDVGGVGRVEIDPLTRLGLVSTTPGSYRMQLDHGTLHALIWAPPGQFSVATPSSTVVDLGCAYSLTADKNGDGLVEVTSGWVGFVWKGRETFVPAGAVVKTHRGLGPGTPHFPDTSNAFRDAIDAIDLGRGSPAAREAGLHLILSEAVARDAVTLWHLLTRVEMNQRTAVFDRLAQFVPPPSAVTREGIGSGDRQMLDRWWDEMGFGSADWWRVWQQQWRER